MSKRINMLGPGGVVGGPGVGLMTPSGNPWTVADGIADDLVNRRVATYADAAPAPLLPVLQDSVTRGLVASDGTPISVQGSASFGGYASITVVGDSTAAYQDSTQAGGAATTTGPTSQSAIAWGFALAGQMPRIINRAVGGKTIDLMIAEQLPAAMADNTDVLWMQAGVNNLNQNIDATLPSVDEILSRMRRALTMAASKPRVALCALTPLDAASISGAFPRRADIPLVNAGYKALAAEFGNVQFVDSYSAIAADGVSGLALPNTTVSVDGIHWTSFGAYLIGKGPVQSFIRSLPLKPRHRAAAVYVLPDLSGTAGTGTANGGVVGGTIASGCNISIATNQAGVVVAATQGAKQPRSQRLRVQNGNGAATVVRFQLTSIAAQVGGWAQNDVARATASLSILNAAGLRRHDLAIQYNVASVAQNISALAKSNQEGIAGGTSQPIFPPGPYDIRLCAIDPLNSAPSDMNVIVSLEVAPGGDVTVDINGWSLEKVVAAS